MLYISPTGQYPRFYGDIQLENPDWKLGDPLPTGWIEVEEISERPEIQFDETIEELEPVKVGNKYQQNFVVRKLTEKELAIKNAPITAKQKLLDLGLTSEEIYALTNGSLR